MERLEKIGKKFNRLPEQVEYDLMSILKWKNNEAKEPKIDGAEYCNTLIDLLLKSNCIGEGFLEYDITSEGLRVLRQGYLIYDYKTPKVEKQKKIRRETLALWIAFLSLLVGFAGLFLPLQKTPTPDLSAFPGGKDITIQDTIDFTPQVDEVAQASDSTSKKDSIKNK